MALQCLQAGPGVRIPVISHRRRDRDILDPFVPKQLLDCTLQGAEYQRRPVRLERALLD
jgi:hypothetical protein